MKALIHLTVILAISSFIYVAYTQEQSQASFTTFTVEENPSNVLITLEGVSYFDMAFNALMKAESNYNQFDKRGRPLLSSSGAVGIAQILPSTAPEACALAGHAYSFKRLAYDTKYNKECGAAYFKKQLVDFNGNLSYAYAAYNAGPNATRAAIQKHGKNWLKHLPYETQNYVYKNNKEFNRQKTLAENQLKYITKPVTVASN